MLAQALAGSSATVPPVSRADLEPDAGATRAGIQQATSAYVAGLGRGVSEAAAPSSAHLAPNRACQPPVITLGDFGSALSRSCGKCDVRSGEALRPSGIMQRSSEPHPSQDESEGNGHRATEEAPDASPNEGSQTQ